jgi:hypothetical protein
MVLHLFQLVDGRIGQEESQLWKNSQIWKIRGLDSYTIGECGRRGRSYFNEMHAAAHSKRAHLPTRVELKVWREEATALTVYLSQYDSDWYLDYWTGKFRSGVTPPPAIGEDLRRAGLV